MNAEIAPTIEALLQPFATESPAGVDCKYDPRNELVRKEIAKLEGVNAQDVDWQLVADQSTELLGQVSKDLGLCCQLSLSWYHLRGIDGLADGLQCLEGLLREFWPNCFPPASRVRGRINLINWLVERIVPLLSDRSLEEKDRKPVERLRQALDQLKATISEQFSDESPSLSELDRTIQRCEITLNSLDPVPKSGPDHDHVAKPAISSDSGSNPYPNSRSASSGSSLSKDNTPTATSSSSAILPTALTDNKDEATFSSPEQTLADLNSQAKPWTEAISLEHPAGEDARYSPEHEAARTEVAKTQAIQSSPVDWSIVYENADIVLRVQAKDLTIATYFAYSLLNNKGIPGLNLGLMTVGEIIDRFWDDLFPEKRRMRGRVATLTWLIEQIEKFAQDIELEPSDRESINILELVGKQFSKVVRERFTEECPPLRSLDESISRLQLSVPSPPEPAPKPKATSNTNERQTRSSGSDGVAETSEARPETTSATPSTTKVAAPSVTTASENLEEINGFLFDTGQNLVSAAGNLRKANTCDHLAYRLIRTGLWLHIDRPPPADASGKTEIPSWPEDRRKQLETLANNQKWEIILDESESDLRQHRFCLDLHRFTSTALRSLGEKAAEAREQVRMGLATLIERIPSLLQLRFQDGSPLADAETIRWINAEVLQSRPGTGSGSSSESSDSNQSIVFNEQIAELEKALSGGTLADYLPTLDSEAKKISDPRQRFLYRLRVAECCLNHGEAKVASLLYSGLLDDAKSHQLESWEPKLCAACISGLILARRKTMSHGSTLPDPQVQREEAKLLSQLGRLDLQMATRLLPST